MNIVRAPCLVVAIKRMKDYYHYLTVRGSGTFFLSPPPPLMDMIYLRVEHAAFFDFFLFEVVILLVSFWFDRDWTFSPFVS